MLKKRVLWLCLALIVTLVAAGCGGQKAQAPDGKAVPPAEKIKFNVGYLPAVGHVLYFVAKDKGFYDEEGLDVELFQFTNTGEGLNAIKSGKLDTGSFGTAGPLVFISKGTPFTIIGGMQSEGHAIVARPENAERFKTPQGFVGAKVATVRLASGDAVWRYGLSKAGIDWKTQVTIQELDSPAAVLEAVKKGSADAGNIWVPFTEMAEQQGLKIVEWSSQYYDGHVCCRLVGLEDTVKNKQEAFIRFSRAQIRAYDFYINNQDATVEILSKYVKLDKNLLKQAAYSGHIHSIPDPDKKRVVDFWESMKSIGYLESDQDITKFINTGIYQQALKDLRTRYPQNQTYIKLESDFAKNDL
ncbi:MAG: ABC transporter substrate-binding protein [Negativicutes bacterium]|nr:ABC transporter substrate-binding protein [Negativicutes bacterium]